MNNISNYINEFWGKHGWLLFAQEQDIPIPNMLVWKRGQDIDFWKIKKIFNEAKERTGKIIIRTSVPDDWRGIIDQMPTKIYNISRLENNVIWGKILEWVTAIEEELDIDEKDVKKHAALENTTYNATNVTLSVSPYYGDFTWMITEHPNYSDALLVDVRETGSSDDDHSRCDLFRWKRIDNAKRSDIKIINTHQLWKVNIIRDNAERVKGMLRALKIDDEMTYQFEYCWDSVWNKPILLQMREFTPKKELFLKDWTVPNLRYFMGNDGGKITLPIVVEQYLDGFDKKENPYAGFIEHWFGQYRKWNLANNAQGVIVTVESCLSHILAQPTVSVIKRWGFALLDVQRNDEWDSINELSLVTVFHDPKIWIQWEQKT